MGDGVPHAALDGMPASLITLPGNRDERGALTFAQVPEQLPFVAQRYFLLHDLAPGVSRGGHAHRALQQFLVCVHGACDVEVDDGRRRVTVALDRPSLALHARPMAWLTVVPCVAGTVVLVLASDRYDEADYIRVYDEFVRLVNG